MKINNIVGILVCLLMLVIVSAINVEAEPTFDVKISGGYGVTVNVTNTGTEIENGHIVWCKITGYRFVEPASNPPGIGGGGILNLSPGESQIFHWLVLADWVHFFSQSPLHFKTPISYCTITAQVYENGGNQTIYGQISGDFLRIGPFLFEQD